MSSTRRQARWWYWSCRRVGLRSSWRASESWGDGNRARPRSPQWPQQPTRGEEKVQFSRGRLPFIQCVQQVLDCGEDEVVAQLTVEHGVICRAVRPVHTKVMFHERPA